MPNKTKEFYQYFWNDSDINLLKSSEEYDRADFQWHSVKVSYNSPFWGKSYHTYHLTTSAEYVAKQIKLLASNDVIEVSLPYILLYDSFPPNEKKRVIQNGEDDKGFPYTNPHACVLLNYSVEF